MLLAHRLTGYVPSAFRYPFEHARGGFELRRHIACHNRRRTCRRASAKMGAPRGWLLDTAVLDPEATVRSDVERLRAARSVSQRILISGHVYDVGTGLVHTVLMV
jgi:carbonic anhydrase